MMYFVIPFISDKQSIERDENLLKLLSNLDLISFYHDFKVVILYWGSVIFDPYKYKTMNLEVIIEDMRNKFPFSMMNRYKHIPDFIEGDDVIHTLDCDMFIHNKYMDILKESIQIKDVFFPVCFSLFKDAPPIVDVFNGWWRESGWGMRVLKRSDWDKIDFSNYETDTGRGEDMLFLERVHEAGLTVYRKNCEGLFHMWHPNDIEYKNRLFGKVVNEQSTMDKKPRNGSSKVTDD